MAGPKSGPFGFASSTGSNCAWEVSSSKRASNAMAREGLCEDQKARVCDFLDECIKRVKYAERANNGAIQKLFDFEFTIIGTWTGGGARRPLASSEKSVWQLLKRVEGRVADMVIFQAGDQLEAPNRTQRWQEGVEVRVASLDGGGHTTARCEGLSDVSSIQQQPAVSSLFGASADGSLIGSGRGQAGMGGVKAPFKQPRMNLLRSEKQLDMTQKPINQTNRVRGILEEGRPL